MDVEAIKNIMKNKMLLTVSDIKTLTGCSTPEAMRLRIETLKTYLPVTNCDTGRTKVRIDKFLDYYNNQYLSYLYKEQMKVPSQ